MKVQVQIYSGGPTGHIAWQFSGAYVSFNRGKKIADLGSVALMLGRDRQRSLSWLSQAHVGELLRCKVDDLLLLKRDLSSAHVPRYLGCYLLILSGREGEAKCLKRWWTRLNSNLGPAN